MEMELILAIGIPIIILGIVYLLIINNQGLPLWVERITENSGTFWTYGIVAITALSIFKYSSN